MKRAGVPAGRRPLAPAAAARPDLDGDQGHRARGRHHDRRRSAAGVLAGRPRTRGGVRVGREGSLGRRLGEVARLRSVLLRGRARDRAAARRRRWRSRSRRRDARPTRRRCRSRSRRATRDGRYRDLLRPMLRVTSGNAPARESRRGRSRPAATKRRVVADARQPLAVSVSRTQAHGAAARAHDRAGSRGGVPLRAARRSPAAVRSPPRPAARGVRPPGARGEGRRTQHRAATAVAARSSALALGSVVRSICSSAASASSSRSAPRAEPSSTRCGTRSGRCLRAAARGCPAARAFRDCRRWSR